MFPSLVLHKLHLPGSAQTGPRSWRTRCNKGWGCSSWLSSSSSSASFHSASGGSSRTDLWGHIDTVWSLFSNSPALRHQRDSTPSQLCLHQSANLPPSRASNTVWRGSWVVCTLRPQHLSGNHSTPPLTLLQLCWWSTKTSKNSKKTKTPRVPRSRLRVGLWFSEAEGVTPG